MKENDSSAEQVLNSWSNVQARGMFFSCILQMMEHMGMRTQKNTTSSYGIFGGFILKTRTKKKFQLTHEQIYSRV
jgi:hypothetical protein